MGKVKLDAIYGREKAHDEGVKEKEPSKEEIYSKVFEVMNAKGLVGSLNKNNM